MTRGCTVYLPRRCSTLALPRCCRHRAWLHVQLLVWGRATTSRFAYYSTQQSPRSALRSPPIPVPHSTCRCDLPDPPLPLPLPPEVSSHLCSRFSHDGVAFPYFLQMRVLADACKDPGLASLFASLGTDGSGGGGRGDVYRRLAAQVHRGSSMVATFMQFPSSLRPLRVITSAWFEIIQMEKTNFPTLVGEKDLQ